MVPIIRVLSSCPVVSTTTTATVSTIPTGKNTVTLFYQIYPKKYWWLRSPYTYTGSADWAWLVHPSGTLHIDHYDDVFSSVYDDFYGIFSPYTFDVYSGWCVQMTGGIYNVYWEGALYDSYG